MNSRANPTTIVEGSRLLLQPVCGKATMEATIIQRWRELAKVADAFVPSTIDMQPSKADAYAVASDIQAIERLLIPLLRDYGDYVSHCLSIGRGTCEDRVGIIADALSDLRGIIIDSGKRFED